MVAAVFNRLLKFTYLEICSVYPPAPSTSFQSNPVRRLARTNPDEGETGTGGRMAVRSGRFVDQALYCPRVLNARTCQ